MKRRKSGETTPDSKDAYEQSYGDAQAGGWAPRRRAEDLAERSRYSSQRDRQEDRSGFRRGYQGQEEGSEQHLWGARHARGDEDDEGPEAAENEAPATDSASWLERKRAATRALALKRKRKRGGKAKAKAKAGAKRGKVKTKKRAAARKPAKRKASRTRRPSGRRSRP